MKPTQARILRKLTELGPMTKHQIAETCHLDTRNANKNLNVMYENLEVYVHSWVRTGVGGGPWLRVWAAGCERDALKPKPPTAAEKARKRRQDPEVCIDELLKKRAKRHNEKMRRLYGNTTGSS